MSLFTKTLNAYENRQARPLRWLLEVHSGTSRFSAKADRYRHVKTWRGSWQSVSNGIIQWTIPNILRGKSCARDVPDNISAKHSNGALTCNTFFQSLRFFKSQRNVNQIYWAGERRREGIKQIEDFGGSGEGVRFAGWYRWTQSSGPVETIFRRSRWWYFIVTNINSKLAELSCLPLIALFVEHVHIIFERRCHETLSLSRGDVQSASSRFTRCFLSRFYVSSCMLLLLCWFSYASYWMYLVCALSILNTSQNHERVHSIFVLNLSCVVARAMPKVWHYRN